MTGTWHKVRPTRYELRDENGCVASVQYFPRNGMWRVDTFDGIGPQTIGWVDTYQAGRETYEQFVALKRADDDNGATLGDDMAACTHVRYADDEEWTRIRVDYDDGVLRVRVNGEAWVPNGPGDDFETRILALELSAERVEKWVADHVTAALHDNDVRERFNRPDVDRRDDDITYAGPIPQTEAEALDIQRDIDELRENARVKPAGVSRSRGGFAPPISDDSGLSDNSKLAYLSAVAIPKLEAQLRTRERQEAVTDAAISELNDAIDEIGIKVAALELKVRDAT